MREPRPMTMPALLVLAGSAVGKVDRDGRRGVTLVDMEEIEAMALLLALLGLPALPRGLSDAAVAAKAAALRDFFNTHFNGARE